MNRQFAAVIWLALVVMSALSGLWGRESVFLSQLMSGNIDPIHWFIFLSLGLFPIYFLVLAVNDQQPRLRTWLYLLGFVFGGFIIFLLEALNNQPPQSLSKRKAMILMFMDCVVIGLFVYALVAGNWHAFLQSYRTDLFVYVMTWDFLGFIGVLWTKLLLGMHVYFKLLFK